MSSAMGFDDNTARVRYVADAGVAWITLAAPAVGNALNLPALVQLQAALQAASTDPACRAIVIDAEGAAFCQGLDLAGTFGDGRQPDPALFQTLVDCLLLISTVRLPVIAMVAGAATGGGVGLVAACDLVLATPTAQFMLSEVVIGLLPAMITPFLLRRLPLGQVRYLTLSSRRIAASEAQRLGLVDELVEDTLDTALKDQLQRLFRSSPGALAASKRYFAILDHEQLMRQSEVAQQQLTAWLAQPEVVEGIQSFADGFSPPWWAKYQGKNKREKQHG